MSELNPQWNLLPGQELDFFGLEGNFDKGDLKKAYNRFIKQFKPEKHPEEFKKIRSAYDELDRQLRYQQSARNDFEDPIEPSPLEQASQTKIDLLDSMEASNLEPFQIDVQQKHKLEDLKQEWLNLLTDQKPLSELKDWLQTHQHYFSKQFIDILSPFIQLLENEHSSLVDILDFFPGHKALGSIHLSLIHDLCRREYTQDQMIALLKGLSKKLSASDYFYHTELIWERLSRRLEEEDFLILYESCTQSYQLDSGIGQAMFLSKFLKSVCLKYDREWLQNQYNLVVDAIGTDDMYYNDDIVILDILLTLRDEHDQGLYNLPGCDKIYKSIKGYFELNRIEGERIILECALQFQDRTTVTQNFTFGEDVRFNLIQAFDFILTEIEESREGFDDEDQYIEQSWIRTVLLKIEKVSDSQTLGWVRNFMSMAILGGYGLINILIIYQIFSSFHQVADWIVEDSLLDKVVSGLTALGIVLAGYYLGFRKLIRKVEDMNLALVRKQYVPKWQNVMFDYFNQHPISSLEFLSAIPELEDTSEISNLEELFYALQKDHAVMVYGIVQRFG